MQDALVFDGKHHTVTVSEHPEKGLLMFEACTMRHQPIESAHRSSPRLTATPRQVLMADIIG
eukprot:4092385-Amphidinium_carterae.1